MNTILHNTALKEKLDPEQRKAVFTPHHQVVVLASAGSGKTRVLTYRLLYLLELYRKDAFLAITFTNKATDEMKMRIQALLKSHSASSFDKRVWISTFHAFCSRILRRHAHEIGISRNFHILDAYQQRKIFKEISSEFTRNKEEINRLYKLFSWHRSQTRTPPDDVPFILQNIWKKYMGYVRSMNMLDFDDLLHETERLFLEKEHVRNMYSEKFHTILIDEFQDTNPPQYRIFRLLRPLDSAFFVVGDQDQSIYGFRGAHPEHFQNILHAYPEARIFPLVRNYRSKRRIVDAAMSLISAAENRIPHNVHAHEEGGDILHYELPDEFEEARWIASHIKKLQDEGIRTIAVLLRARSQLPPLETVFQRESIPYKVLGLRSWWESPPIRILLDYLSFFHNPEADPFLTSICNIPSRRLGPAALKDLRKRAGMRPLWQALLELGPEEKGAYARWKDFRDEMLTWLSKKERLTPFDFVKEIISFLSANWNIDENRLESYQLRWKEFIRMLTKEMTWEEFYTDIALRTPDDSFDEAEHESVTIQTVHSAKGLEFDVVFIPGVEEGLYPHHFSYSKREIDEERRVFFVAVTRARMSVYLSSAMERRKRLRKVSSFIRDMKITGRVYTHEEKPWEKARAFYDRMTSARHQKSSHSHTEKHSSVQFRVGRIVHHPKYGVGTVIRLTGSGQKLKVEIQFSGGLTKLFYAEKAPLTILS